MGGRYFTCCQFSLDELGDLGLVFTKAETLE